MAKKKITLNSVRALQPGQTIWDTELKGFGCRCQAAGKFFVLKYSIHGRQRLYTIGRWDNSLTPEQAREQAEIKRGEVRQGVDVSALKEAASKIPLVQDAFKSFLSEIKAKRSARTHAEYERTFTLHVKPEIGNYNVNAVSRADIAKIHHGQGDTPYQANRILALLSSFFSWCDKNGHRTAGANPCRYIEKFKESARERMLSESELFALGKAIGQYEKDHAFFAPQPHRKNTAPPEVNAATPYVTAALRLLFLTGARCNEILTLKWQDVDFSRKLIRLQESKTGQKTIYLSSPALQLLEGIPRIKGNPYVICGRKDGSHLVNIKDAWREIRAAAGLEDVRIHDLRHNYASTAVTSGHHLKVIGALLGHANTRTTEKYAHLADDPLQMANEAIGKRILDAMTAPPVQNTVVAMRRNKPKT